MSRPSIDRLPLSPPRVPALVQSAGGM
jgi:hypothetical protein